MTGEKNSEVHEGESSIGTLPLCVDLDGTLLKTDSLHELLVKFIKYNLWSIFKLPFWVLEGKAAFKSQLAERVSLAPHLLPYNEKVLDFVRQEKEKGREVYLCTGANISVAQDIARHIDLFDGVIASQDAKNITGGNKAGELVERFGVDGYAYIGNHHVDFPVWESAGEVLVTGASKRLVEKTKRRFENVTVFERDEINLKVVLKAARVHQWVKNALLFVPLLLDHKLANMGLVLATLLGFLSFSLMASATYVINDLLDLEADRAHPKKSKRPFASGELSVATGFGMALLFFSISFFLLFFLPPLFAFVALVYLVSTLIYSFHIKTMVILDACLLAGLFTIRVIGGTVLIDANWSFWLLAFSMFFFLSLAFTKRASELNGLIERKGKSTAGRGYIVEDMALVVSMGVSSGYIAVLVVAFYINSDKVKGMYASPEVLWLICPLLLYWVGRMWMKTVRGEMNEDPIVFAIKDRISHLTAVVSTVAVVIASIGISYG